MMHFLPDAFLLPNSTIDRRFTYALTCLSISVRICIPIPRIVLLIFVRHGKLLRACSRYTQEARNVIMWMGEHSYGDGMEQRDSTLDQHAKSRTGETMRVLQVYSSCSSKTHSRRWSIYYIPLCYGIVFIHGGCRNR
jgi:hypothetical protein